MSMLCWWFVDFFLTKITVCADQRERDREDALYNCSGRNMDLASILDKKSQAWAELVTEKADAPFVWLGLHYTCTMEFWFWVKDHSLQFSRWAPNNKIEDCDLRNLFYFKFGVALLCCDKIFCRWWVQTQCSSFPEKTDGMKQRAVPLWRVNMVYN